MMLLPSCRRLVRFAAGALLALAVFAAAPSTAQAGCSHYAITPGQHDIDAALARLQILAEGVAGTATDESPALPAPIKPPCSGPTCSENPSHPGAPSVPPAPSLDDRCCTSAGFLLVPCPAFDGLGPDDPSVRPLLRPSTIDRPPRIPTA